MNAGRMNIALALIFAWSAAAMANVPGGGTDGPDVSLETSGDIATLSNGIITARINVSDAEINAINYRGNEMVNNTGRHQSIYFSMDGGDSYETLTHCISTIVARTPEMVDLSCKHVFTPEKGDKHCWNMDVHFILRRGTSGLYVYAAASHPADYPQLGVGEWRMVWSSPESDAQCLQNIYVDALRHWRAPTPEELGHARAVPGAPKEVTQLTNGSWAGRYDCKYMYSGQYWNQGCWGIASDRLNLGEWVVFGSHEFFTDGPNKQDLDEAVGTTLIHLNMNHYDGTSITIPQGQAWQKFYGPWLLYCNSESGGDACWADAKKQADAESAAWPYSWLKNPDYPSAAERGTVRGNFSVRDALKPKLTSSGGWIGLAMPEHGPNSDFEHQATGYQFWVHVRQDGSFVIPAVRPGNYELYAYVTGAVGEFKQTPVDVRGGETTDLSDLTWDVPHKGRRIAWEIGIPDRSAAEFWHGKDYFLPLLYKQLWEEIPNPLEYTVGQSDWATDWNYAQTRHGPEDHPEPARWRIHFALPQAPAGEATLTLAFAGADRARLGIFVNDENNRLAEVVPSVQGGNGLVREAVHTKYSVSYVPIPGDRLRAGQNTITLVQESVREPSSYVMYDYLNLELP